MGNLYYSQIHIHVYLSLYSLQWWINNLFQILLQMLIIITGNYNFFNLLTIALCISLVEDDFLKRHKGREIFSEICFPNLFSSPWTLMIIVCFFIYCGMQMICFVNYAHFLLSLFSLFLPFWIQENIFF